ncbi:MAG: PPC domain-containing protein [Flavobacteriales bacterium]|nr:PPC domain-containing protein [Flavobacteriales bacterium]
MRALKLIPFLLIFPIIGLTQCANNNTFWTALNPTGPGNSQSTGCIWGGEYVTVNVCIGATYTFSTCGSTWDTQITVYASTGGGSLAYNDDGCGMQSLVSWNATFTGTVWVLVDAWPCLNNSTCATLTVTQNTACGGGGISNDPCTGAIALSCGQTISGNTIGAASDALPAGCYVTTGAPGLWYSFVGDGQNITLSMCGSGYDTQLSVFTGTCGGLSCVANNDDFCGTSSQVTFLSSAGTTYYILVFGFDTSSGAFTLSVTCSTPPVATNQDCAGAITICNDQSFGGNSAGEGNYIDLNASNQGCLGLGENQTSWYVFSPLTTGTIQFSINPIPLVDYDFAIYGPMTSVTCPPPGPPIRCSYSALYANTGLASWATDLSEGVAGDAWVSQIVVGPGEIGKYYILVLDNFSVTTTPFTFDWTLTGVTLDCAIMLPVEWLSLSAVAEEMYTLVEWAVSGEEAMLSYVIQKSYDGLNFETIASLSGHGLPGSQSYSFADYEISPGVTYYRIEESDVNGQHNHSDIIAVERSSTLSIQQMHPNPTDGPHVLNVYAQRECAAVLRYWDALGRAVMERNIQIPSGNSVVNVDNPNLEPGIYHLKIESGEFHSEIHRLCIRE